VNRGKSSGRAAAIAPAIVVLHLWLRPNTKAAARRFGSSMRRAGGALLM
jgi:hypothetical protein